MFCNLHKRLFMKHSVRLCTAIVLVKTWVKATYEDISIVAETYLVPHITSPGEQCPWCSNGRGE
jgi:hypothetical protein